MSAASAEAPTTHPQTGTIRVLVAASTPIVCDALATRLTNEEDFLALSAPGGRANVQRCAFGFSYDIAVFEVTDRARDDEDMIGALRGGPSRPAVVVLVPRGEAALAARMIAAGASGAVLKTAPASELVAALRLIAGGAGWISPPLLVDVLQELRRVTSPADDAGLARLSGRQREVIQLMVDGLGRRQISDILCLSVDTVRTHMRTIMEKLNVHAATAAVSIALEAGMRPRL